MNLDPFSPLLDIANTVIKRIWKDPEKQAEQLYKLEKLAADGRSEELQAEVNLLLKQAEINLADAKSDGWFQANWRPSIGWICSLSLLLSYVPKAIVQTYIWTQQSLTLLDDWNGTDILVIPAFPDLGMSDVIGLLLAMLGVAGMRSFDKLNGINTVK